MKNYSKILTTLKALCLFVIVAIPIQKTYAANPVWDTIAGLPNFIKAADDTLGKACNPTKAMFEAIAIDQPQQSIVRFGYNYDTVRPLKLYYNTVGLSPENTIACIPGLSSVCILTGMAKPANCDAFLKGTGSAGNTFADSPISGSLLGMAYKFQEFNFNTPPPVNLAYFWNKQIEDVPVVGKAWAQNTDYTSLYLKEIYTSWKFFRNISFALMTIIMLVTGILIITRRKLDPQTVVTVQYAIPRVVIAIILIAFSYPIGATIANLGWNVATKSPITVIMATEGFGGDFVDFFNEADGSFNFGAFIGLVIGSMWGAVTIGPVVLLVGLLTLVIALVVTIILAIRFLVTYIKMVFSILTSPLTFVWAALPGNDSKIADWFKKMATYVVTMIALLVMPTISFMIGIKVAIASMGASPLSTGLPFGGIFVSMLLSMFITIIGLVITLQLPAKVEVAIMGDKASKKAKQKS